MPEKKCKQLIKRLIARKINRLMSDPELKESIEIQSLFEARTEIQIKD